MEGLRLNLNALKPAAPKSDAVIAFLYTEYVV